MALPITEIARQASAGAAVALVVLLLVRHVMQPQLNERQRLAFDVAIIPLLSVLGIFIVADFLGALP